MQLTQNIKKGALAAAGWLPDALMVAGAAAVAYGAGLMYEPAGFVVAGAFLLAAGWLTARGGK